MSTTDPRRSAERGTEGGPIHDANHETSEDPLLPRENQDIPLGDTDQHSKAAGGKRVPGEQGLHDKTHLAND